MTEEINLKQTFTDFVNFISRNKNILFGFIFFGVISVIIYQNIKPSYFETQAICMSGIAEYERIEQLEELSQRTAVDLINHLQINISNKDYSEISSLLNLTLDESKSIKTIEAEQLYQQDMNEKFYALNKFEVRLSVFDNNAIESVQSGLINYFNNNGFIKDYHNQYLESNESLIDDIKSEMIVLSTMRMNASSNSLDLSSVNIISGKDDKTISNQIISLAQLKEEIRTNQLLLTPLVFVTDFAKTNKTERDLLIWSILGGFISLLFGLLFSFVRELK
ncbi:MAG: hypothetical protein ACKVLD_05080 [Flavobacteriales bacterium]|jgi:hypothetical protein|tara:strand:+ start:10040 stop:10873 length:834 start_codon:yes stop_codon:yes gene_type:complete